MHQIEIPRETTERASARRGRVEIFDSLEPAKTALIVIDMQNCFLLPGGLLEVPASRDIVPNINRLARSLRSRGGSVFWTQHSFERAWTAWYGVLARGDFAEQMVEETAPGSLGYGLHSSMDVQEEDVVVHKIRYSAMLRESSGLHEQLRSRDIDTVIVTGTLTNVCCESTARDAMMMNYKVVFVSDGNATRTDADHNGTLASIVQVIGDVRSTEEVAELIEAQARAA